MEDLKTMIFIIRDRPVMLDSDVARLYDYETKRIIETVKRNKERFPDSFCFQLKEELVFMNNSLTLRSQIATSNVGRGGRRYLPYVFTEQGIAMLSGVLKSKIAVQVSINIINAFVEMRRFMMDNSNVINRLTKVEY